MQAIRQGHNLQALVETCSETASCQAGPHYPNCLNQCPKLKDCKLPSKATFSRLWLGWAPKLRLQAARQSHIFKAPTELTPEAERLQPVRATFGKLYFEPISKAQGLQAAWPGHLRQFLVEIASEAQGLQAARQGHILRASVEIVSDAQRLRVARQGHILQDLVESDPETQELQAARQGHIHQALFESVSKAQRLQDHIIQALVEIVSKTEGLHAMLQSRSTCRACFRQASTAS